MKDSLGGGLRAKVDGEEVILHITDQSVMFEKAGKVNGFERSAIRMVKPDGRAMVVAYSTGSEVKSVRVEPMTLVASLLMSETRSGSPAGSPGAVSVGPLDEVFEKLYWGARRELEERLAKVQEQPESRDLRLSKEEEERYVQVSRQMESMIASKYGLDPRAEDNPISFWGLEKQPYELELEVVKVRHLRFLRMLVESGAERNDIAYSTDEVWPEDWPRILDRFKLESGPYATVAFNRYIGYLKSHWKHHPGTRKPALAIA